jgi:SAM-dependent methyltransferase
VIGVRGFAFNVASRATSIAPILADVPDRLRRALLPADFRCAGCGGGRGRLWTRARGWSVVRCRDCGLLRTWPPPDAAVLRRAYEDPSYFATRTDDARGAWAQRAGQVLAALGGPAGPVLDFGAGEGQLVRALRDAGVDADGVEPSPAARANALRELDVELRADLAELPARRFGAATLLHSLEHVDDPAATLARLRGVLAPGAAIYVEVPHAGSADMWLPRSRQMILDLPVHLHHFTPRTLAPLVERAGFDVVTTQLFNARPVELALALRERLRASEPAPAERAEPADASATAGDGGDRPALARLRRALPGWKFWLVARTREPRHA